MKTGLASPRTFLSRLAADRDGVTAVEFAVIMPILLFLTIGLIDISRFVWYQTTLEHAAREGSRYASVRPGTATAGDIEAYIYNRTIGISDADLGVTVSWTPTNAPGNTVTINVSYDYSPIIANFLPFEAIQLSTASTLIMSQI
ncbi:MAG: TadE/TadG family type IV pilus assembly protein [Alphaproteobacteria bacterium]|nr:TadE/TadG family type IV pilus assembly protein [Alphaproteobacteria bacterium]